MRKLLSLVLLGTMALNLSGCLGDDCRPGHDSDRGRHHCDRDHDHDRGDHHRY